MSSLQATNSVELDALLLLDARWLENVYVFVS
jgi:hypothetical protein